MNKITNFSADGQYSHLLTAGIAASTFVFLASLWLALRRSFASNAVATVPGPPSPSWIYGPHLSFNSTGKHADTASSGNMTQLHLAENYGDFEFQWQKKYGPLYRIKGCFGVIRALLESSSGSMPFRRTG
jgi:hypothetical protein